MTISSGKAERRDRGRAFATQRNATQRNATHRNALLERITRLRVSRSLGVWVSIETAGGMQSNAEERYWLKAFKQRVNTLQTPHPHPRFTFLVYEDIG